MTHYNPIFRYGDGAFLQAGAAAGLSGVIIPDLPADEAGEWQALARTHNIAPVMLEAPNTDAAHAGRIAEISAGFVYMVSLKGVTGSDKGLGENLAERVQRMRASGSNIPLAVGFGISTPEHAQAMGRLCDGVVIGTEFVNRMHNAPTPRAAQEAAVAYVREMRAALDAIN